MYVRRPCRQSTASVWAMVLALAVTGCQQTTNSTASKAAPSAATPAVDIWEAYFLKGAKIGYGHTVANVVDRAGEKRVETRSHNHLELERFGQTISQDLQLDTVETPDGEVLSFNTDMALGPNPVKVTGQVAGDVMIVRTSAAGGPQESRIPWSRDIRGFRGVEQSLEAKPLSPGEKRTLRVLVPLVNQVADVELTAAGYERTALLQAEADLLRIEGAARLSDGNVMNETLWTDRQGQVLKRRIAGLEQESYRTSEKVARAAGSAKGAGVDLGFDTMVPVDPPLANPHQTRRVRYRVDLNEGDPAKIFAAGDTQTVRSLGPHAAEITVRSIRPGEVSPPGNAKRKIEPAPAEYTTANSVLQIDDPRIRQMAQEARGAEKDPIKLALALEQYVHRIMSTSDLSQAFGTAAEVAQSRSGDCTEHAVLLAALARACGIPSRVAIGLVYVERAKAFGYHMWTEVYLDGAWVPLDATLGQGGIGAGHLKLVDSSLVGATAYSAFLPVARVVGQLKIKVLEAK